MAWGCRGGQGVGRRLSSPSQDGDQDPADAQVQGRQGGRGRRPQVSGRKGLQAAVLPLQEEGRGGGWWVGGTMNRAENRPRRGVSELGGESRGAPGPRGV